MNKKSFFTHPVIKSFGVLSALVLVFAACKKDAGYAAPPSNTAAALAISHAAPQLPAYDFKINGAMVLQRPLKYGNYLDYNYLTAGKQEFSLSAMGSTGILARTSFSLKPQVRYSIYIVDSASKPAFLLSEDDLSAPPSGKAKIRFVNLSPDAGALDLSVQGRDSALFTKTDYRTSTDFKVIDTASAVKVQITQAGDTNVLSSNTIKIEKNKVYTLRAVGLKAATDSTKLGLSIITNK